MKFLLILVLFPWPSEQDDYPELVYFFAPPVQIVDECIGEKCGPQPFQTLTDCEAFGKQWVDPKANPQHTVFDYFCVPAGDHHQ